MSSWRLAMTSAPALREVVADAHDRGGLVALDALVDVVGDQRVELALAGCAALDDERLARAFGGPVADDDHPADADGVDHALAVAGQVTGQLDARPGERVDGGHDASSSPAQRAPEP